MNPLRQTQGPVRTAPAFTLIELLVVITIIAVLAALAFVGVGKFTERARSVQALSQFRDLEVGMRQFSTEYNRPLVPPQERAMGRDTVYGDSGGQYSNDFVVAVLAGSAETPWRGGETDISQVNPREETYVVLPFEPKKRNGVGNDGVFYDPWGREVMIGVNAYKGTQNDAPLRDEAGGENDRILETYRIGEYEDTKPREIEYAFWSFGADGKKGDGGATKTSIVRYAGSDDVISWK